MKTCINKKKLGKIYAQLSRWLRKIVGQYLKKMFTLGPWLLPGDEIIVAVLLCSIDCDAAVDNCWLNSLVSSPTFTAVNESKVSERTEEQSTGIDNDAIADAFFRPWLESGGKLRDFPALGKTRSSSDKTHSSAVLCAWLSLLLSSFVTAATRNKSNCFTSESGQFNLKYMSDGQ